MGKDQMNAKTLYEKIKVVVQFLSENKSEQSYKLKSNLWRDGPNQDKDEVYNLQSCLEFLTGQSITQNGHFGRYTEKLVKMFQQSINIAQDGIVNELIWQKIIGMILV